MLTPTHARMARAALKWSLVDLQEKSGISKNTLVRFEAGGGIQLSTAIKIEAAFLNEGIRFIYENDADGLGVIITQAPTGRANSANLTAQRIKSGKRSKRRK